MLVSRSPDTLGMNRHGLNGSEVRGLPGDPLLGFGGLTITIKEFRAGNGEDSATIPLKSSYNAHECSNHRRIRRRSTEGQTPEQIREKRTETKPEKLKKKMDPRNAQRGPCTFNVVRKELGRFMNEKTPPRNKNPSGFAPVGGTYGGGRE